MRRLTLKTTLPYILLATSFVGIIASAVLIYDQVQMWRTPDFTAPCSLNPVLSCGSVINSQQGHVFGIPAPFLGLVMFPALAAIGVVLVSGAKLKRWVWLGLQAAVLGGVVFALWLFWVSLFKIRALCPYCLVTDVAVLSMAWYVTLFNIEQGFILTSKKLKKYNEFARKHHLSLLIGLFLAIAAYILHHFWYYYGRNF